VNDEQSPLAQVAEISLPLLAGTERSVAATKTFIASLLAIAAVTAAWTGDRRLADGVASAPQAFEAAWRLDWSPAVPVLSSADNLFVLGRGLTLGIAQEAALKFKETCGIHAEAYSLAEVQHGPMTLVGPGFPVLMFVPRDEAQLGFKAVAENFLNRGAQVLVIGDEVAGAINLAHVAAHHPVVEAIASAQAFYKLVNTVSLSRGLDPDRPPHLSKVTETH
jgi:glucosamine--fructose-6-phosphate aminotransferase (isomerizing)